MTKSKMLALVNSKTFSKFIEGTSEIPKSVFPKSFIKSNITRKNNNNDKSSTKNGHKTTISFQNKKTDDIPQQIFSHISKLLQLESCYYLDCSFLFFVDPVKDDKVNAEMRDNAIINIQILNKIFYELPIDVFIKSVALVDRFITKVKVKPKYIACVTTACFYIATKIIEPSIPNAPSLENLCQMTKCGGSADDLERMTEIILTKLQHNLEMVTSYEFLLAFYKLKKYQQQQHQQQDGEDNEEINIEIDENDDDWLTMIRILEQSQSSLRICWQRPSLIALACLVLNCKESDLRLIRSIAMLCKLDLTIVSQTVELLRSMYRTNSTRNYNNTSRSLSPNSTSNSTKNFVWIISKRTLSNIYTSLPTSLMTISEECCDEHVEDVENDDADNDIIRNNELDMKIEKVANIDWSLSLDNLFTESPRSK